MALRFHNTLGNRMEEFRPQNPNRVTIYTCGPTVYAFPHIGNFRYFIFTDILRRVLSFCGYEVCQAMNITDVDDKIIRDAKGQDIRDFTRPFIEGFFRDLDRLNIQRVEHYPKATEHIPEIASLVHRLAERGHAYESEGSWYFRIGSFGEYGKLSNLDGREIRVGARVENDEYEKADARDFALWKGPKESEGVSWETEIGPGRPGWHTECSAMSMKYLGETLDIHAGGEDLIFPHHENEIAQSEAATGVPFARYWLHTRHLLVNGEKMSKSKGNYFTIEDLIQRGHSPLALRYNLLSVHYRQPLNFTDESARSAESALQRLRDFRLRMDTLPAGEVPRDDSGPLIAESMARFRDRIENDLDMPGALAAVFDLVREGNTRIDSGTLTSADGGLFVAFIDDADRVLGVLGGGQAQLLDAEIDKLIKERQEARKSRNFARADAIRDELQAKGIILEDTKDGVRWKLKG